MKNKFAVSAFTLVAAALMAVAGCTDSGENIDDTPYLGENYSFNEESSTYTNPAYAEGTVFEHDTYNSTVHWVENNGDHIFTLTSLPKDAAEGEKFPVIIMCHGYNGSDSYFNMYIPYLIDSGFACVTFNFRGGCFYGCKSSGRMFNMTIDTELSDAKAVTAFVEQQSFADTSDMILAGHSQGGLIAALAAGSDELAGKFDGLLLLAPGFSIIEANASAYYDGTKAIPEKVTLLGVEVSGNYIRSLLAHKDLYTEIAAFKKPVKILLGTKDALFKEKDMQGAIEAYGDKASLDMIEGADHGFSAAILETMYPEKIEPFLLDSISD